MKTTDWLTKGISKKKLAKKKAQAIKKADKYLSTQRKMLKPCPTCGEAWFYVSDGDYYSGYESRGIKVQCNCEGSFFNIDWQPTRNKAAKEWNKLMNHRLE